MEYKEINYDFVLYYLILQLNIELGEQLGNEETY